MVDMVEEHGDCTSFSPFLTMKSGAKPSHWSWTMGDCRATSSAPTVGPRPPGRPESLRPEDSSSLKPFGTLRPLFPRFFGAFLDLGKWPSRRMPMITTMAQPSNQRKYSTFGDRRSEQKRKNCHLSAEWARECSQS